MLNGYLGGCDIGISNNLQTKGYFSLSRESIFNFSEFARVS